MALYFTPTLTIKVDFSWNMRINVKWPGFVGSDQLTSRWSVRLHKPRQRKLTDDWTATRGGKKAKKIKPSWLRRQLSQRRKWTDFCGTWPRPVTAPEGAVVHFPSGVWMGGFREKDMQGWRSSVCERKFRRTGSQMIRKEIKGTKI